MSAADKPVVCARTHVAVLGGSFDPVHNGHVAIAEAACSALKLDRLLFMPAKQSPLKTGHATGLHHRMAMLELALKGLCSAFPDTIGIDQRELTAARASYTALSMRELREELGADAAISFLMGWDSLQTLDLWWQWQSLFELVNIAVVRRPGYQSIESSAVKAEFESRLVDASVLSAHPCGKIAVLAFEEHDIASSAIRTALIETDAKAIEDSAVERNGEGQTNSRALRLKSIAPHVPADVLRYIDDHELYFTEQIKF